MLMSDIVSEDGYETHN